MECAKVRFTIKAAYRLSAPRDRTLVHAPAPRNGYHFGTRANVFVGAPERGAVRSVGCRFFTTYQSRRARLLRRTRIFLCLCAPIMDNQSSRKLIQLCGTKELLWNSKSSSYHNKSLREDACREVSSEMGVPVPELKKKMTVLLSSYRREKWRISKSQITGSGHSILHSFSVQLFHPSTHFSFLLYLLYNTVNNYKSCCCSYTTGFMMKGQTLERLPRAPGALS